MRKKKAAAEGRRRGGGSFEFLSDGIPPCARGWRDESGRKKTRERKREEGEEEDVVVGRCENAKRTHPSGRQDWTINPYGIYSHPRDTTRIYLSKYTYMGHILLPGTYLCGVTTIVTTTILIMGFGNVTAPWLSAKGLYPERGKV